MSKPIINIADIELEPRPVMFAPTGEVRIVAAMEKIDLRKDLKHLYLASAKVPVEVEVPPMNFLMVDGAGDPNVAPAFAEAVEALFSVSYAAKFLLKKEGAVDYGVMPLEGLWWVEDMARFSMADKASWQWTAMIMQPDCVSASSIERAMAQAAAKKRLPALERLRFESFAEGRCAQVLHVGPFAEEGPTVERLHRFIGTRGQRVGKHHEIYLSDMRRADPAKWKTVIRQPMA